MNDNPRKTARKAIVAALASAATALQAAYIGDQSVTLLEWQAIAIGALVALTGVYSIAEKYKGE